MQVCSELNISRSSFYRWKSKPCLQNTNPGPRNFDPQVFGVMTQEICALRHDKRKTWGAQYIYDTYGAVIPRNIIRLTIKSERTRQNRIERQKFQSCRIIAPDIAWSIDFKEIINKKRVIRMQDECTEISFVIQKRDEWKDEYPAEFAKNVFALHGRPYFLKHDLGGEYRSKEFQLMLKEHKVIAFPNPPHYPQANGKHERVNGIATQWLLPLASQMPTEEEVFKEMGIGLNDNNMMRRKDALDHQTPFDAYRNMKRININRDKIYARWEELTLKLMNRREVNDILAFFKDFMAMRVAALIVLNEYKLVKYFDKLEVQKV